MNIDLDRYFNSLQPRADKREGCGGKRKGEEEAANTVNKQAKENWNSRGLRTELGRIPPS